MEDRQREQDAATGLETEGRGDGLAADQVDEQLDVREEASEDSAPEAPFEEEAGEDESSGSAVGESFDASGGEGAGGSDTSETPSAETIKNVQFDHLHESKRGGQGRSIEMLYDISLPVSVELGRTTLLIKDVLDLGPGSVVELNKLAGEPVDILVNGKLVARGEVVVVDENFGVRISNVCSPEERVRNLT